MSEARATILQRIREALHDVPDDDGGEALGRHYHRNHTWPENEKIRVFTGRVEEYKAKVRHIREAELTQTLEQACRNQDINRLAIPPGLPEHWVPDHVTPLRETDRPLTHRELDAADGVLTSCELGIAQTGTLVLNGGAGQGRRALTLIPDYHLCVIRAEQIVGLVPEAFAHLENQIRESGVPVTFISGPSATSDIELSRVEGVHGPRRLEVVLVLPDP